MSFYVICSRMEHVAYRTEGLARWTAEKLDRDEMCPGGPHFVDHKF